MRRSPSSPLAAAAAASFPLALAALALLLARPAAAQNRQQPDAVRGVASTPEGARAAAAFARAQRLVAEGQGAAGRAIVDSTIAATDSTSPVFPEGLFWRASLSATAADAERDYRTLAVEYPLSPRSSDALLRLAQLEMARGDRALALKHLERLTLEHPTSAARPRASYWMARVYFEDADVPRACAALGAARANAAPTESALRAQIDVYAPRCKAGASNTALAAARTSDDKPAAAAPTTTAAAADGPGTRTQSAAGSRVVARDTISIFAGAAMAAPASTSAATTVATTTTVAAATTRPASAAPSSAPPAPAARTPGATEVPAAPFPSVVSATAPTAAPRNASSPAVVRPAASSPAATAAPAVARPAAASAPAPALATAAPALPNAGAAAAAPRAARTFFSVQLAAFDAAAPAEAMAARLRAHGVEARVSGAAAPFRVRVGHYATSGAAAKAAASFKARGQPAFVVDEPVGQATASGTGPR